jgi:RNA polymerase sigma-70 factor (ECF subfamily)
VATDNCINDDEIIQRITRCQRELRTFIVGLTPSQADADDVLQEVNLALWKKRHLYDLQQEFLRWAFGFAVLEVRSFRSRSAKSRLWFGEEVLISLAEEWPGELSAGDQRREALNTCLNRLAPPQREMITAFYGKRVTALELAARYDRPLSTIYKIITRIRELLRECVTRSLSQMQHPH